MVFSFYDDSAMFLAYWYVAGKFFVCFEMFFLVILLCFWYVFWVSFFWVLSLVILARLIRDEKFP